METKNVLFAIILSTIVIFFFNSLQTPITEQQNFENEISKNQNSTSPSIDEDIKEIKKEITRSSLINKTNRIKVENQNIKGSISLQGAIIDDVVFKNYKEQLDGEKKVSFLNPKNSSNEYFIETGWVAGNNDNIKLPLNINSVTIIYLIILLFYSSLLYIYFNYEIILL